MNNKLFVGNLPYSTSDGELQELFAQFGDVVSCNVAKDRETGKPRGFGFVEMQSQEQAEAAIKGLNGHTLGNRQISVVVSQPKPSGRGGGGGGGGRRY